VLHVAQPLPDQPFIGAFYVRSPGAMRSASGKLATLGRWASSSARWNTDHRHLGQGFVFEQVGVLQQAQKEIALLFKRELQQPDRPRASIAGARLAADMQTAGIFAKCASVPSPVDPQVFATSSATGRRKAESRRSKRGCRPD